MHMLLLCICSATSTSLWPKWDTDYTMELTHDTGSVKYSGEIGLSNDKPKRITVTVGGTYDIEGMTKKIGGQGTFRLPHMVSRINYILCNCLILFVFFMINMHY